MIRRPGRPTAAFRHPSADGLLAQRTFRARQPRTDARLVDGHRQERAEPRRDAAYLPVPSPELVRARGCEVERDGLVAGRDLIAERARPRVLPLELVLEA